MSGLLAGSASRPIATTQASAGLSSVTARELETRLIVSPLAGEPDELGIVLLVSFAGSRFRWGMGPHGAGFQGTGLANVGAQEKVSRAETEDGWTYVDDLDRVKDYRTSSRTRRRYRRPLRDPCQRWQGTGYSRRTCWR